MAGLLGCLWLWEFAVFMVHLDFKRKEFERGKRNALLRPSPKGTVKGCDADEGYGLNELKAATTVCVQLSFAQEW